MLMRRLDGRPSRPSTTSIGARSPSRVIDPLLDAVRVEHGARVVDVGTGSGDAAGRAADRGAIATGVDVAAAMVEIAAQRHPAAQFIQASATQLPFADGSFDAAVGNMVIQHIGEPERAALELVRVLVSGGRLALSTWDAPERCRFSRRSSEGSPTRTFLRPWASRQARRSSSSRTTWSSKLYCRTLVSLRHKPS